MFHSDWLTGDTLAFLSSRLRQEGIPAGRAGVLLGLWLCVLSVCPRGAMLVSAGALREQDVEMQPDGMCWGWCGEEKAGKPLLPGWSNCAELQRWRLALEEACGGRGGNAFMPWSCYVRRPDCP